MNIQKILEVITESSYPLTSKEIYDKIMENDPKSKITRSQISSLLFQKDLKPKVKYDRSTFKYALREENKITSTQIIKTETISQNKNNSIVKNSKAWKDEEIILALELYFDPSRGPIHKGNPKIIKLSQLLNSLSLNTGGLLLNSNFRSPSSIALKLTNFLAIDPNYVGSGMKSHSKLDEELFYRFHNNKTLLLESSNEIRTKFQKQLSRKSKLPIKTAIVPQSKEQTLSNKPKSVSLSNEIKFKREEVEYLPLPERCKNIITSIGGLNEAFDYFKRYKHFEKVRNCGKLTNLRLCEYFESFSDTVSKVTYHQKISFKEIDLSVLSERAYNVITNFEDFTEVLNFYQKTKSFISLNNCGSKTNVELINLVENFLTKNQSQSAQKISYFAKNIFEKIYLTLTRGNSYPNVVKKLNYYYLESGDLLWEKLLVLDEKSLKEEFNLPDENDFNIELSVFLKSFKKCIHFKELNILTFDSHQFKETNINISVLLYIFSKSVSRQTLDIQEYFALLNQFYTNEQIIKILLFHQVKFTSNIENNPFNQFLNELYKELIKTKGIFIMDNTEPDFIPLNTVLNNFSLEKSIEYLELLDRSSNLEIFIFLINSSINSQSKTSIVSKLFFDENYEGSTLEQIANEHNLSRERVRQIKYNVSRGLINTIFKYLIKIKGLNFDGIDNHFLIIDKYHFFGIEYIDNELINQLIAINFSKNINLHEFVDLSEFNNVIVNSEDSIYLNTNLINENELFDILVGFNNEPDFNFEVQIKSLRNFNKILDVREFIDLFSLKESFVKSNEKENKERIIVNEIRKYLKIKGKPVKTEKLLNYLISEKIVISRSDLLTYLNNAKDLFTIFGQGNWALVSWRDLGMIDGSLIEIIKDLLIESSDPLHISEIYYFLNEFAPTSIQSILSNLKSSEKYKFQFFNCSYIGLHEKEYSNYYHNLPIVVGFHFNQSEIDKLNLSTWDDILKYFEQEYGYPKIHVEYLLINNFDV